MVTCMSTVSRRDRLRGGRNTCEVRPDTSECDIAAPGHEVVVWSAKFCGLGVGFRNTTTNSPSLDVTDLSNRSRRPSPLHFSFYFMALEYLATNHRFRASHIETLLKSSLTVSLTFISAFHNFASLLRVTTNPPASLATPVSEALLSISKLVQKRGAKVKALRFSIDFRRGDVHPDCFYQAFRPLPSLSLTATTQRGTPLMNRAAVFTCLGTASLSSRESGRA